MHPACDVIFDFPLALTTGGATTAAVAFFPPFAFPFAAAGAGGSGSGEAGAVLLFFFGGEALATVADTIVDP